MTAACGRLLVAGANVDAVNVDGNTRRCGPLCSTARDAVTPSADYEPTEPTPGTETTPGATPVRLARTIADKDLARFFADLGDSKHRDVQAGARPLET